MKKFFAIALVAALALSLAACDGKGGDDFNAQIFFFDFEDPYLADVRASVEEKLQAEDTNYNINDGKNNQDTQMEQIEAAIGQGAGLLVVNQVETKSEDVTNKIISQAKDADIPVLFFNREISDSSLNSYKGSAVFVGTDAEEAGYLQGELVAEVLLNDYDACDLNGDGVITYIMFKGQLGNPEAEGRTKCSVEKANELLKEAGKPELVFYDPDNLDLFIAADWVGATAKAAMADALAEGAAQIELVLANNDDMALGAISALNDAGFNNGEGQAALVFGVDATVPALEAMKAGKMAGTVKQDAVAMAQAIVDFVKAARDDVPFEDVLATFDNVDLVADKVRIPYVKVNLSGVAA
jgi:methyl-galactoside transport system substrate-binding protein